ncbi:uncharacterized protein LOC103996407 isoform X1 [Musa acuminata AAA Group]|uniref:uncharacterized protein LOC103996407 isoform X1 n=2 Tax=Musa acuminata AAA Group TaxID=214697 RepID=UPI0031E28F41
MVSEAGCDDEETQVLDLDSTAPGEVPILYGETEALDGSDSSDGEGVGGIDQRGKTQLVNEYEDTAVVDSGDEETDRTEVLSGDDEGVLDDGATRCGDREDDAGDAFGPEVLENGGNSGLADEKKVDMVDSDASTDDGGGDDDDDDDDDDGDAGSTVRSFTAVRTEAMRTSGLAAARYFASRKLGHVSRSFNNIEHSEKEDSAVDGQIGLEVTGVNKWTKSRMELTPFRIKVGKLDLDHEIASFQRSTQNYCKEGIKSRCCNMRVKRLFNELLPSEKNDSIRKDDSIFSKVDTPYLLSTDDVVAGLSYVNSQEPSIVSQANALESVDKFLLINDVGLSQETKDVETDILKSSLVSGTKRVQLFSEKTNCRSPVGKPQIFDWNDNLEDDGGGEFFSKRKDSFFEQTCGAWKTQSQHPTRHLKSAITRDAVGKSGEVGTNRKIFDEGTVHSDSRLMISSPVRSKRICISETNIRKNLFEDTKAQLDVTEIKRGSDGIYDVGPDTQMAAEAMEALVHGFLNNAEKEDTGHLDAENLTLNSNSARIPIMNTASSKNVPQENRTSVNDPEVIVTRSKRRKMLSTKSSESRNVPRVSSTSSRMKNSLVDIIAKRQAKRGKGKPDRLVNTRSLVSGHDYSKSTLNEKTQQMVDRHFDEQQKQHNDILVDRHLAHRVRYSKRVKMLKQNKDLPDCQKVPNKLTDAHVSRTVEAVHYIVSDTSESVEAEKGCANVGLNLTTEVKRHPATHTKLLNCASPGEEFQTLSLTKDSSRYPKRRRTGQVNSGNMNGDLNKASPVSGIGASETIERSFKQQGKEKIFTRSISDILDKVQRKKRSVFTYRSLEAARELPSTSVVRMICGMKTRSSLKPSSDKDTEESVRTILLQSVIPTGADILSVDLQNHSLHAEKAEKHMSSSEYVENAEENDKSYGSSEAKGLPNNLTCTTPSKEMNAVSPVFTSQYPPRSCNKVVSTSLVARELLRLDATGASTPMLKDMRRRKYMAGVRVLFSHHLAENTIKPQKKILARLGLPTASSISDATHFVTDRFVRTQNMLEAIAVGKLVVTPMWLESCGQAGCFMDEKNYILRDLKKEREIGFSMPVSLARACHCPLLQGKKVFITPNVKPNGDLVSSLVKASRGQTLKRIGRSEMKQDKVPDDLLVISCEEDYNICIPLLEKGAGIFSSELLLNGIVIQKLEYERHQLFADHIKQTRSTTRLRHKGCDQFLPENKCA